MVRWLRGDDVIAADESASGSPFPHVRWGDDGREGSTPKDPLEMRYGRLINHPDGEAASMLHWSAGWRRLLDLPKLSPILHELFGGAPGSGCEPDPEPPNFRMDHMYLQRLRKGFPGGRLHGGPRLHDQPGWYYEKRAGRSFNGLTTVVFELLPVEACSQRHHRGFVLRLENR